MLEEIIEGEFIRGETKDDVKLKLESLHERWGDWPSTKERQFLENLYDFGEAWEVAVFLTWDLQWCLMHFQ